MSLALAKSAPFYVQLYLFTFSVFLLVDMWRKFIIHMQNFIYEANPQPLIGFPS